VSRGEYAYKALNILAIIHKSRKSISLRGNILHILREIAKIDRTICKLLSECYINL